MSRHRDDDLADARRRARQAKSMQERSGRFNPPPNAKSTFRILKTPADQERDSPALYIEFLAHNNVGPKLRFLRCGNEPGEKGNCWLCKKADKLQSQGRTKEAAKLRPQKKMAINIAILDQDSGELVGPLVWIMTHSKKANGASYKILNVLSSDKSEKYLNHRKGRNLTIKRVGEKLNTTYPDPLEIDDERSRVPKEILSELKPFVDCDIPKYDEEYAKDSYYGKEKGEDDDMASKNKKKAKKKHHNVDDDDDEELDDPSDSEDESEDDDDDDESDRKKKKKKKSKKSKKDDDDDDDSSSDDDEDEEDEEDEDEDEDEDDSDNDDSDNEDEDEDEDDDDEDESEKKSKKKKKKKSKKDDDDDDDDDEDEDDDDEDDDDSDSEDDSSNDDDDEDEDEDDEDEDDDDESDKKSKKKKGKKTRKPRSDKGKKRKPRKKKGKK